jgi:hypothetical protein
MLARDVLGFRGPGRFAGGRVSLVVGAEGRGVACTDEEEEAAASSGGRHNGHFFASAEPSGTSTTSLARQSIDAGYGGLGRTQYAPQQTDISSLPSPFSLARLEVFVRAYQQRLESLPTVPCARYGRFS